VEEHEIHGQLKLSRETLGRLVAARLLRSENRSESTYYELSHDALVEPILASSRGKARAMAMLGIGYGALAILVFSAFTLVAVISLIEGSFNVDGVGDVVLLGLGTIGTLLLLPIVVWSAALLRGSARSMRRYRGSREPAMAGREIRLRSGSRVWLRSAIVIFWYSFWSNSRMTALISAYRVCLALAFVEAKAPSPRHRKASKATATWTLDSSRGRGSSFWAQWSRSVKVLRWV
jgi:hypothetical protein